MPEFNFKSPVVTRKVRETEIILEEVIPSPFFKEIGIESMLDADGRVILDKSINYGKQ